MDKNLRKYELVWILGGESDGDSSDSIETVKNLVDSNGGAIDEIEELGKRSLAYPIKKNNEGIYFSAKFQVDGDKTRSIDSSLMVDQKIIRYLMIKDSNSNTSKLEQD